MDKEKQLEIHESNIRRYEAGELDNLYCRFCDQDLVSVYFQAKASQYGRRSTYFVCHECKRHDRAQYKDEPPHFSESRLFGG